MSERRSNWLGRLVVAIHQRYYEPRLVPWLWIAFVVSWIVQIVLLARDRS